MLFSVEEYRCLAEAFDFYSIHSYQSFVPSGDRFDRCMPYDSLRLFTQFRFGINFSLPDVDLLLNIFWYLFRQKHVHQKNSKDKSIINVVALFSVSQPP